MASPRAKNTASPKEVAKLFRGANVTQLPPEENYMVADLSKVAEKYEDLIFLSKGGRAKPYMMGVFKSTIPKQT